MKKITWLFMSLMLFLGVASAQNTLPTPTFSPANNSTVPPGMKINITLPAEVMENADDYMAAIILYVENNDDVELAAADMMTLYKAAQEDAGLGIMAGSEGDETRLWKTAMYDFEQGLWWSNVRVSEDATGTVKLRMRLAAISGPIEYSDEFSAEYTIDPDAVVKPTAPTLTLIEEEGAQYLSMENGYADQVHFIVYKVNGTDADFPDGETVYAATEKPDESGMLPYEGEPIEYTAGDVVKAVTLEFDVATEQISMSDIVTYPEAEPEPEPIAAPTYSPESGSTVAPGDVITFNIPTEYQNYMAYLLYTTDATAFASATTYAEKMALVEEVTATDDEGNDTYTGPIMMAGWMNGSWLMPCKIPSDAEEGELTLQAFLFIQEANIVSEIATASYTVEESETPVVEIPIPTFDPVGGVVAKNTIVNIECEDSPDSYYSYMIYRVLNNEDFDFSQYTDQDDTELLKAGASYMGTYKVTATTKITAATAKVDIMTENIVAWSAKVSATYTVEEEEPTPNNVPAPTFNPDGGAVLSGTKVILTNGTENDATPKPIYYNFKENDAAETAFSGLTTKAALDAEQTKSEFMRRAIAYPEGGIELTSKKTISAATADIDAEGNVTWSTIITKGFTISMAPVKPVAPTFTPDGGNLQRGTAIKLAQTNTGSGYYIYYSFESSNDVFTNITTSTALGAADGKSVFEYSASGILIDEDTTIRAAVVLINDDETLTWSDPTVKSFTLVGEAPQTVATPVIAPANDAIVHMGDMVTITCATDNAEIYYTTDGSAPYTTDARGEEYTGIAEKAIRYTEPFALEQTMLVRQGNSFSLRIRAVAKNGTAIKTAAAGYVVYPNAPTFSPVAGEVVAGTKVAIKCVPDSAKIYYTIDGTTPTEGSTVYTDSIEITAAMTIKAIAVLGQYDASASAAYTIKSEDDPVTPPTPVTKPDAPKFEVDGVEVTAATLEVTAEKVEVKWIGEANDDYTVIYTLDGSEDVFGLTNASEFDEDANNFWNFGDEEAVEVTVPATIKARVAATDAMGAITWSDMTTLSLTLKGEDPVDPEEITLTFNPASGATVEEGTAVTITANANIEIFYMMFESEAAAKAAEWDQEKAESYSEELKPVLSKERNTLKVAYALEGAEALVDTFFYATYTINEQPAITLTFNPASGSEVKDSTTVTVTASRETEIYYNLYADSAAAAADTLFIMNAKKVNEDGMPVITENNTYLRCGVYDRNEMKFFYATYTIKGEDPVDPVDPTANEGKELAGVSVYPNPNSGTFYIELPVAATVDVFASNGVLVKNFTAPAGKATLSLDHSGIYFVRIVGEGRATVKRVIVR